MVQHGHKSRSWWQGKRPKSWLWEKKSCILTPSKRTQCPKRRCTAWFAYTTYCLPHLHQYSICGPMLVKLQALSQGAVDSPMCPTRSKEGSRRPRLHCSVTLWVPAVTTENHWQTSWFEVLKSKFPDNYKTVWPWYLSTKENMRKTEICEKENDPPLS